MNKRFSFYVLDTETTGLESDINDIIEIAIIRVATEEQKLWRIKPINSKNISQEALRVNGHKMEDLLHRTQYGIETYMDPSKAIIEIENWLMEDGYSPEDRMLIGQNINFDINMLRSFWKKCNSHETYPFSRYSLDTMQMALIMDLAKDYNRDRYNLSSLAKEAGIKVDKAHTAAGDTLMTLALFKEQIKIFKKVFEK